MAVAAEHSTDGQENDREGASPESHNPVSLVTVWAKVPLFVHITLEPTVKVTTFGWKLKSTMVTTVVLEPSVGMDEWSFLAKAEARPIKTASANITRTRIMTRVRTREEIEGFRTGLADIVIKPCG
jgi:hypothetical protein